MDQLLLHAKTKEQLVEFTISGNHAVLLSGSIGAGLSTLAQALAKQLLGVSALGNAPYYSFVEPEGKYLTIEQIRGVQSSLTLRTTGANSVRRVIVLHHSDTMTDEAQNALLKSLEEPPADTVLILTATRPQNLKQTIHSRLQTIVVRRVALDDSISFFNAIYDIQQITWAHAISDGQVGLMKALLENKQNHPIASQIAVAKQLYGMSQYDRMLQVESISKEKDTLPDLLYACKRICTGALESAALKNQEKSLQTWYKQLSIITTAEEQLRFNPNTKLFLTNLFIQM